MGPLSKPAQAKLTAIAQSKDDPGRIAAGSGPWANRQSKNLAAAIGAGTPGPSFPRMTSNNCCEQSKRLSSLMADKLWAGAVVSSDCRKARVNSHRHPLYCRAWEFSSAWMKPATGRTSGRSWSRRRRGKWRKEQGSESRGQEVRKAKAAAGGGVSLASAATAESRRARSLPHACAPSSRAPRATARSPSPIRRRSTNPGLGLRQLERGVHAVLAAIGCAGGVLVDAGRRSCDADPDGRIIGNCVGTTVSIARCRSMRRRRARAARRAAGRGVRRGGRAAAGDSGAARVSRGVQ